MSDFFLGKIVSETTCAALKNRFLISRKGKEGAERNWDALFQYYTEEHRAYHNLNHLQTMFGFLDETSFSGKEKEWLETAIFYHDIIYDSTRKDNEQASADLWLESEGNIWPKEKCAAVSGMIVATHKHLPDGFYLTPYLLDIDLAILGAPKAIYRSYTEAIRMEYGWVPDEMYRVGRAGVMTKFMERPRIFFTDDFFDKFEVRARENLSQELDSLQNGIE